MHGEITTRAAAAAATGGPAFEIVYEFDAKLASRAYKRFLWQRVQRVILVASAVALGCLVAMISWEPNLFLILDLSYPYLGDIATSPESLQVAIRYLE